MNTHASSEHGSLPLAPIEQPTGLLARIFFWSARRRYGRVPITTRVIYARAPFIGVGSLFLLALEESANASHLAARNVRRPVLD